MKSKSGENKTFTAIGASAKRQIIGQKLRPNSVSITRQPPVLGNIPSLGQDRKARLRTLTSAMTPKAVIGFQRPTVNKGPTAVIGA